MKLQVGLGNGGVMPVEINAKPEEIEITLGPLISSAKLNGERFAPAEYMLRVYKKRQRGTPLAAIRGVVWFYRPDMVTLQEAMIQGAVKPGAVAFDLEEVVPPVHVRRYGQP